MNFGGNTALGAGGATGVGLAVAEAFLSAGNDGERGDMGDSEVDSLASYAMSARPKG